MVDAELARLLRAREVGFCVIGAAAMAAHGWARYTADVDLLTMDARVLAPDFWPDSPAAEIHRGDADDPLEGVVRLRLATPHDLIVGRGFAMRHAVDTAEPHAELGCPVATPGAIVLLKLEAGGPQDQLDVVAFVQAQREVGDAAWLADLPALVAKCSARAREVWKDLAPRLGDLG